MLSLSLVSIVLTLGPSLVSAGLFSKNSGVTMLDPKAFKKAMKTDETSIIAFVAPWCGHCQRMTPEFSKAAKSLSPLIPFYAVDCDDDQNKSLCAEQGVQGFPTVKVFPRGQAVAPMLYQGERTASAFVKYVSLRVPQDNNAKLSSIDDVEAWVEKTSESSKPRALLLTKEPKVPTLWKVLSQRYKTIEMGIHKDVDGKSAEKLLGVEGSDESKVLVYNVGTKTPTRYDGKTKLEPLSKFFNELIGSENGSKDEEEKQEQERMQKEKREKEKKKEQAKKAKKETEKKEKEEKKKAKKQAEKERKAAESESTGKTSEKKDSESNDSASEHPKDEL